MSEENIIQNQELEALADLIAPKKIFNLSENRFVNRADEIKAKFDENAADIVSQINEKIVDKVYSKEEVDAELDTKADRSELPSKLSELDNDNNTVTDENYIHTDNNYTNDEKTKLVGIEEGAKVNVQADWKQNNSSADDFIKHKPTKLSDFTNDNNTVTDAAYVHTDNNYDDTDKAIVDGVTAGLVAKANASEVYTKSEVNTALSGKVDKESGKGLSEANYTNDEKTKLVGIEEGAEVNVQSDWAQSDNSADDFIKNKPSVYTRTQIDTALSGKIDKSDLSHFEKFPSDADPDELISTCIYFSDSFYGLANQTLPVDGGGFFIVSLETCLTQIMIGVSPFFDADGQDKRKIFSVYARTNPYLDGSGEWSDWYSLGGLSEKDYTAAEKSKLEGIASGAEVNVQSDWNQSDSSADDYINNKPDIDTSPIVNSDNLITSGGVVNGLSSLYDLVSGDIDDKEDKPTVEMKSENTATGVNACSLAVIDNVQRHYTSSSFSAVEFNIPNGQYPYTYGANVSFNSPATPTQVSYSATKIINWVGTDCSVSGTYSIFAPVANKHYDIIFYFNGSQFIGLVNGYVPAGGNS